MNKVEKPGVFCWNHKPIKVKVPSTVLYYAKLSCRVTAYISRDLANFSHEPVRVWSGRLKDTFPKPEKKRRKRVAVDETKLKLSGKQLWTAVDAKTKEVLACRISWQRCSMQAEAFLRKVLAARGNKPLTLVE